MNFLLAYFGQHKDEKIVYFCGSSSNFETVKEVLSTTAFKEVYLVIEDPIYSENLPEELENYRDFAGKIQIIALNKVKELPTKEFVFAFDHCSTLGMMNEMSKLAPKKVVGWFGKDYDTFKLWEFIHENCEDITLAKEFDPYRNDVLKWKKADGYDCELSVIFPVYKVAPYLTKCLDSVTQWKAPYVEYVFVDDGSPDESADIIREYAKKDPRVKLLQKENGGCASARQYGIDHTNSRYIGLIDPDDFIDPTMFKKLLSAAMMGTYDISYSGYYEYYEETKTFQAIEDVTGIPYTFGTNDEKLIDELIAFRRVAIWRAVYRREFLEMNSIHFHTEIRRFDDLPFKVETFARAKSVIAIDEPLYYYRMGRPGQDVSANDERLYVHFDIFKILDEFFKQHRSSRQLNHYYQVKVNTHFWALNLTKPELKKEYRKRASADLKIKNTKHAWKKLVKSYYRKREWKPFLKNNF